MFKILSIIYDRSLSHHAFAKQIVNFHTGNLHFTCYFTFAIEFLESKDDRQKKVIPKVCINLFRFVQMQPNTCRGHFYMWARKFTMVYQFLRRMFPQVLTKEFVLAQIIQDLRTQKFKLILYVEKKLRSLSYYFVLNDYKETLSVGSLKNYSLAKQVLEYP